MRLPAAVGLKIQAFSGGSITVLGSGITNGIIAKRSAMAGDKGDQLMVTQRPTISIFADASDTVTDARGRASFYWEEVGSRYFVNNHQVYKGNYSTKVNEASVTVTDIDGNGTTATATATSHGYADGDVVTISGSTSFDGQYSITYIDPNTFTFSHASSNINESGTAVRSLGQQGTEKVYFHVVGDYLVILDPENNQGWYINKSTSTTMVLIGSNFPSTLAHGGAVLNGYLYVSDANGNIQNCDNSDPTTWGATNLINAEREPDGGLFLTKHHDHIVLFGPRTIEFFWDAGNPTDSPLSRRQDIFHSMGCLDGQSVWVQGDRIFYIGVEPEGAGLGVFEMTRFQPRKVSETDMDTYLNQVKYANGIDLLGSGFTSGGRAYFILTLYETPSNIVPRQTVVYDPFAGEWYIWSTSLAGMSQFPFIGISIADTTSRSGEGIMANGDLVTINDNYSPLDAIDGVGYVEQGYVEDGYVVSSAGSYSAVDHSIVFGMLDGGTTTYKFCDALEYAGDYKNGESVTISHSDNDSDDFGHEKNLDISKKRRLTRRGRFVRRNHMLSYNGSKQIRTDGLDLTLREGRV